VYVHAKHAFSQDFVCITPQPCAVLDKGPDPSPLQLISYPPILLSTHLWIGSNHEWRKWYSNLSTLQCLVFVLHWEPTHIHKGWIHFKTKARTSECSHAKQITNNKNELQQGQSHWHPHPHQTTGKTGYPTSHLKFGLGCAKLN